MDLKNKKILVTGSEGFIGSHLVERLLDLGANVRSFILYNSFNSWGWLDSLKEADRKRLDVVTGNICDAYNVRQAIKGIDVVFHLAALIAIPYSYYSPESYVAANVMGTLNVLQAAREAKVEKFVHTSTSETYGTAIYAPIDEKHPLQGQSPYSASKIGADMMAESFYRSFDMPVAICRPFNTYGPRQSARAVIPTIISQIAAGAGKVRLGSLTPVRDLTFVEDTVDGMIKVAEAEKSVGEVINIGSGIGITIGEIADKIISLMDAQVEIEHEAGRVRPEKSEVMKLICDNRKALDLIGWKPKHMLEQGLEITIDFIKNNLGEYKPAIYNL